MRLHATYAWLPFVLALAACGSINSTTQTHEQTTGWSISTGVSSSDFALQGLEFYPTAMTIDAGDTVSWHIQSSEPHTITLLGPGQTKPPPPTPQNLGPAGGTSYDGSAYVSSGLLTHGSNYSLTFPTPGTYNVFCILHQPEMELVLTVQPAGTLHPLSQSQYSTQAQAAASADLVLAQGAPAQFPYPSGGTHLAAGISPGLNTSPVPSRLTVLRFLDGPATSATNVNVAVGTSVTWTNLTTNEPHTVTFGIVGLPFPHLDPFGPPTGGSTYDGTVVTNSGILAPGATYTLKFTRAGTYSYHCLLHDSDSNMIGTVTVH
jgi:plastocyanin